MPRCILYVLLPALLLCSLVIDKGNAAVQLPSRLASTSEPEVLLRQLKRYREAAAKNPEYSNDWAVQVYGGEEAADEVAALHGFINMGKVKLIIFKIFCQYIQCKSHISHD